MHCRGLVLADPVEGDDDGALERRREEHRGGMRAVVRAMLDQADIVQVLLQLRRDLRQLVCTNSGCSRRRCGASAASSRSLGSTGGGAHRGVFVEDDPVEIVDVELQRVQRGANCPYRKTRIVLDAAQPLLVDRETDKIVIHHRERAVVVVNRKFPLPACYGPRAAPEELEAIQPERRRRSRRTSATGARSQKIRESRS